ncbi:MAG TPA: hypothetical protein VG826_33520 [Pirellulales bacterium]|nr:hypothetical protein [Pirellulales bacterium]
MQRLKTAIVLAISAPLMLSSPQLARAADDYRVEALNAAPPAGEFAPAVAEQLSANGFKVVTGPGRTLCEVWPAKSWQTADDFKPTGAVNYPFEVGELLGVIRFARSGGDFRGQKIKKGAYTIRYGLQPQDGNHVGTSDTRDFVVLVPAAADADPAPVEKEKLFKESTGASGTAHPAILSLLPPQADGDDLPRIVQHESRGLWAVDFAGKSAGGKRVVVELVVVGHSGE